MYVEDEAQVLFYTGHPSLALVGFVLGMIESCMSTQTLSLSQEQEFVVLIVEVSTGTTDSHCCPSECTCRLFIPHGQIFAYSSVTSVHTYSTLRSATGEII